MLVFGSTLEISVDYEYPDYQENFKRIGPKTLMALQISGKRNVCGTSVKKTENRSG